MDITLRSYLTRLVWLCIAPIVVLAVFLAYLYVDSERTHRESTATNLLQNLSRLVDLKIESRITALETLAESNNIDSPENYAAFYDEAQRTRSGIGGHIILSDLSTQMLVNTRSPLGSALPKLPRPEGHAAVPAVLATGKPAIGDSFIGPVAKVSLVAIVVPVKRDGKITALILNTVETTRLQELLDTAALPVDWTLTLSDSIGKVIARRESPQSNNINSDTSLLYSTQLINSKWSIALEVPATEHRSALVTSIVGVAIAILMALIAGILGGGLSARRLERSVTSLINQTATPSTIPSLTITEVETIRKRIIESTASLRESEFRYRELFESNPHPMWVYDLETLAFLAVNEAAVVHYGYSRDEFLGMTIKDIRPDEDIDRLLENVANVTKGLDTAGIWRHRRKNGSIILVEISSHTLSVEGRRTEVVLAHDVTKRIQAEQELQRSEERLRQILDHSAQVYYSHTVKDELTYMSPQAEMFFDCRLDELPKKWTDLLTDNPINIKGIEATRRSIETGVTQPPHQLELITKKGRIIWVDVHESPVVVNGETVAVVGALTDITERKKAADRQHEEEARHRLQRNALITFSGAAPDESLIVRIQKITETDAKTLGVSRVSFWRYNHDHTTIQCVDLYELEEDRHSSGTELHASAFPSYFHALEAVDVIAAEDAQNDSRTLEFSENYLKPIGITSMLDAPVHLNGMAAGVLCHEHVGPRRRWTADEESFAVAAANLVSLALEWTERKQSEERVRRLNRVYMVLSGINELIVRCKDRMELCEQACHIAVERGGFDIAWIGMLDHATLDIQSVAWAGTDAIEIARFPATAHPDALESKGVLGRAIQTSKPVFDNDITTEKGVVGPRRVEAIRLGYRSMISLPLVVDRVVIGHFSLYSKEKDFFTDEEIKLLSELSGDISFALDHIHKSEKLDFLSYFDVLTGLPNRGLFHDRLKHQLDLSAQQNRKTALLLVDIKRFRFINESMGRQFGDSLLRTIAKRLRATWPNPDALSRISNDTFSGFVERINDTNETSDILDRFFDEVVTPPITIDGKELSIAMTAGIAVYPDDGTDIDQLFSNAEAALKEAKIRGERHLHYKAEMNAAATETLTLESKLRRALARNQFVLHYQPKINLIDGSLSGFEALIRWNDPETGLVPPAKFIPLLEETGMINEIGLWAIQQALADHLTWNNTGLRPPRVAVNVSATQLAREDFVEIMTKVVEEAPDGTTSLDIEITESMLMQNIESNIEKLRALRRLGLNIAIDDFGTGYSSLGYLARLPLNALKIDRSFIITMKDNQFSMTIVSTIISLAHSLNLRVVAEGVDSEEQRELLKNLGCDEMQGYLFSRPLAAADVVRLLSENITRN